MTSLNLKSTHKPVKAYYESLQRFESIGVSHETAVRSAFQALLEHCGRQFNWILVPEHAMTPDKGARGAKNKMSPLTRGARGVKSKRIVIDGALIDTFQLPHGYWEAKDIHDDLPTEVLGKFETGYPRDNILFQTPHRAILWQNNQQRLDADLTDPKQLIHTLETFFSHRPQEYTEWEEAVAQFRDRVPALGNGLATLIEQERGANREFTAAFTAFHEKCRQSINPTSPKPPLRRC